MIEKKTISQTDEQLLAQYRKTGDPALVGKVFNQYMHLVYGLCLKYLKSREDSQDAVMSIYEKVSESLLTTEVQHFKSWLYMVSKNYCLMELRRKNPENNSEVIMENYSVVHLNEEDPVEAQIDALHACIEELKHEQKRCIELFYLEKRSYVEVDEATGIGLKKVKSHIQNGKRNLKICIEAKNVEGLTSGASVSMNIKGKC